MCAVGTSGRRAAAPDCRCIRVGFPRSRSQSDVPARRSSCPSPASSSPCCSLCMIGAAFVVAACGSSDSTDSTSGDATVATRSPTARPTRSTRSAAGTLTIGTDKPAYPPYFEDNDPTNGKGFESAIAYAIADQLGFSEDQVEWTVVPFNSSYAPGPEGLRLRHQPDLDHPEAGRAGRLLLAVLHGRPGGRRAEGLRRRRRDLARRPRRAPTSASRSARPASTPSTRSSSPTATRRSSTPPTTSSAPSSRARSTRSSSTRRRPST